MGRGECVGRVQLDFMFDMKSRQGEIYHDNNNNDNLELSQRFGNICSYDSCNNISHIQSTNSNAVLCVWASDGQHAAHLLHPR